MKEFGKKRMIFLISTVLVLASFPAMAVEYMYRGSRGYEHYSCGAEGRGGIVKVMRIGDDRFRIYSKRVTGDFEISTRTVDKTWCLGPVGAVRIVCGFCKVPIEQIMVRPDR
jgi:hypothetical protein